MSKIYVTRRIPQEGLELLSRRFEVEVHEGDGPLPREEFLQKIADADGVLGLLSDKIDVEFFEAAKNLKGYANYAVGFDNIDIAEATRRGIPVSNTPDVLTKATAELAWALLFAVTRRMGEAERHMRTGEWKGWGPLQFVGGDVWGKTLGIVGTGRIGTTMGLMSRGFSMRVLYCANHENETLNHDLCAERVPLKHLLAESDFISLHVPLNDKTKHMLDKDAFRLMKRTAYLINTSRGPVINEADLVDALTYGEIAGAGLDVYEFEPKTVEGLLGLENAVCLPHIGSATRSARVAMAELAARNLMAMIDGKRPETCLNGELFGPLPDDEPPF